MEDRMTAPTPEQRTDPASPGFVERCGSRPAAEWIAGWRREATETDHGQAFGGCFGG